MNTDPKCGFCKFWSPIWDNPSPYPKHGWCNNKASENHKADMDAFSKCNKFQWPTLED